MWDKDDKDNEDKNMKKIMNVKMKLKMKMMVKVGDNVGYHVFKVIFVDLCVFKVILWNWYRVIFCKKKYIGASLYVEIKINWVEHFQEDVKFWIFEQIYGGKSLQV